ncbi:MAG: trehalose-6-phosphate synthase [Chthoniobacteraceae bacterium]|nr:trehalose-6-phosphate synthase [Chthoniobacteraceae bacterium]
MTIPAAARPVNDDGTVVIVAHRGPHDFVWEAGQWVAKASANGLVSMIEPLARQPNVAWFCCVSEPPGSESERDALYTTANDQTDSDLNVVPVPLPAGIYHEYYGVISNEILWRLHHHLVGQFGYTQLDQKTHRAWDSYLEANRRLAEAIRATEIPVRAFLIQDYHLYPLAEMLRRHFPETPILHFIHIPFPEPAILKLLPKAWRETLLRGLLGCNVIGLQTAADVRSFLACCQEILGATVDLHRSTVILSSGRTVRVRAFPASIDPEALKILQQSAETTEARQQLASSMGELSIIRVDRLDPSKNQIIGFNAFERLLDLHPQLIGHVRFLAFLIPSRTDLTVYLAYRDAVYREIKRINSRFSRTCGFNPIEVFYTSDRTQALAAMESCDVFLVNSGKDGMNLFVKEWAVISRKPGVLVVSETVGVALETRALSLQVCALDVEGIAKALAEALFMPADARSAWLSPLRANIEKWTARDWLVAQLRELEITLPEPAPFPAHFKPATQNGVVEWELQVLNKEGIHARPAAAFVRCARSFLSEIEIIKDGASFSAKSILSVLTANLNRDTRFILRASGVDATAAAEQIRRLLETFEHEES